MLILRQDPLPYGVHRCELGILERPDLDWTIYQKRITIAWNIGIVLLEGLLFIISTGWCIKLAHLNQGLPWKNDFMSSALTILFFFFMVIHPSGIIDGLMHDDIYAGHPFDHVYRFSLSSGMSTFYWSTLVLIPMRLLQQYKQLKGKRVSSFERYIVYFLIGIPFLFIPWLFIDDWGVYKGYNGNNVRAFHQMCTFVWTMLGRGGFWFIPILTVWIVAQRDATAWTLVKPYTYLSPWLLTNFVGSVHFWPLMWGWFIQPSWFSCWMDRMVAFKFTPKVTDGVTTAMSFNRFWGNYYAWGHNCFMARLVDFGFVFFIFQKWEKTYKFIQIPKWFYAAFYFFYVLTFLVPWQLPNRPDFQPYFQFLMIFVWFSTAIALIARRPDESFIDDWSTAGLVRFAEKKKKNGKNQANLEFYGGIVLSMISNAIFLIGLVTSPLFPWKNETNLQSGDILAKFDLNTSFTSQGVAATFFYIVIWMYIIEHLWTSFSVVVSPTARNSMFYPIVKFKSAVHSKIRFILYAAGSLPALRVLLSGTKCESVDGIPVPVVAINKNILCTWYGDHLALIMLCFFLATWFVGFNNLRYSYTSDQSSRPGNTRYPATLIVENVSAFFLVGLQSFNPDGATLAGLGLLVLLLNIGFYMTSSSFMADVRLVYLRCSIFAVVFDFYFCALLSLAAPNAWWPFIILIITLPAVFFGTLFLVKKKMGTPEKLQAIKDRSIMVVRALGIESDKNEDGNILVGIEDLSTADMSVAMHSDRFQTLLTTVLKRGPNDSWDNPNQLKFMKQVAKGFLGKIGLKSLDFDNRIIKIMAPYLEPNVPSEYAAAAIKVLHPIRNTSHKMVMKDELFETFLRLFGQTKDAEVHELLADLIGECLGNTQLIIYAGDIDQSVCQFHELAKKHKNGIFNLTVDDRQIWFFPEYFTKNLSFEPRSELFTGALSFPPVAKFKGNIFQKYMQATALYIPTNKDVTNPDDVKKSEELLERPRPTKGTILPNDTRNNRYALCFEEGGKSLEQKIRDGMFDYFHQTLNKWEPKSSGTDDDATQISSKHVSPDEEANSNNMVTGISLEQNTKA